MPKQLSKITKHWPINKILELYPDAAELMLEIGLHCFGCSSASIERLNDGMKIHGFTDEEIDEFVSKINAGLQEYKQQKMKKPSESDYKVQKLEDSNSTYYQLAGIKFTNQAFEALHELLDDFTGLQIKLELGGCSGYTYLYDFKLNPEPEEYIFQLSDNLQIFIDEFTFDKLHGSIIDFNYGIKDAGLKFINPNITDSCHCGTSVGF